MKIENLSVGQTVWSVSKGKMGNTTVSTTNVHAVTVLEIDMERRRVLNSWNGNPAKWAHQNVWSKWRAKQPVMIESFMGRQRIATRAEIKAMESPK